MTNTFIGSKVDETFKTDVMAPQLVIDENHGNPTFNKRAQLWKDSPKKPFTLIFALDQASANQKDLLAFFISLPDQATREPKVVYYSLGVKQGTDSQNLRELSTRAVAQVMRAHPRPEQQNSIHAALSKYLDTSGIEPEDSTFSPSSEFALRHLDNYFLATYGSVLPDPKSVSRIVVIFVVSRNHGPFTCNVLI